MKSITLDGHGGVEVLTYSDVPSPTPGEGQVLIEVAAAGVNFMDIGKRQGMRSGGYDPAILGVEGAGRGLVPSRAVGFVGQVDEDHVVRVAGHQGGTPAGIDHVVGRRRDVRDRGAGRVVADAGERFEAGHGRRS